MTVLTARAMRPRSTEWSSLTMRTRQEQRTSREAASRMKPTARCVSACPRTGGSLAARRGWPSGSRGAWGWWGRGQAPGLTGQLLHGGGAVALGAGTESRWSPVAAVPCGLGRQAGQAQRGLGGRSWEGRGQRRLTFSRLVPHHRLMRPPLVLLLALCVVTSASSWGCRAAATCAGASGLTGSSARADPPPPRPLPARPPRPLRAALSPPAQRGV